MFFGFVYFIIFLFVLLLCNVSATTHADIFLRAVRMGVKVQCIHNAGIITAAGVCGLELYSFGHTVSIPFFTGLIYPIFYLDILLLYRKVETIKFL
jgi:diphthamide biosynthesis methyltransferase